MEKGEETDDAGSAGEHRLHLWRENPFQPGVGRVENKWKVDGKEDSRRATESRQHHAQVILAENVDGVIGQEEPRQLLRRDG